MRRGRKVLNGKWRELRGACPGTTQIAVAEYIKDMADELAGLAGQARLPLIVYLLHLVRSEAATLARKARLRGGSARPDRRHSA